MKCTICESENVILQKHFFYEKKVIYYCEKCFFEYGGMEEYLYEFSGSILSNPIFSLWFYDNESYYEREDV